MKNLNQFINVTSWDDRECDWVTLYHPENDEGVLKGSRINWSTSGSQNLETTELFVACLMKAVKLRRQLNKQYGVSENVPVMIIKIQH